MRSLSDTLERLARFRAMSQTDATFGVLKKLEGPRRNPGALTGWYHLPDDAEAPALVVVLHGCTQNAAVYDRGSGWTKLAEDFGFAVLFPEQARDNNANLCFNWFVEADTTRDGGEACSIRDMIAVMIDSHGVDPHRVFITGLSAGGAMANAMLAVYPDVFAGGAIIAGLPYATATTVPQAFDRMRGHGLPSSSELQQKLRSGSRHGGPWPAISVWHGTADRTVDDANGLAIVDQWKGVHRVGQPVSDKVAGQEHIVWKDEIGRDAIELYRVAGMGHGTPLDVESGYGKSGPYMLDVGISSTEVIARGWGLIPSFAKREPRREGGWDERQTKPSPGDGIRETIENALRTAGLMK